MQEDPAYAREAVRAGARGYVPKHAAGTELVQAIWAAAGGGTWLNPALGARMAAAPEAPARARAELSDREVEVLRLIALGHTNNEIAERLFLSVRTVEIHRAHIQQKLGRSSRAELVRYASTTTSSSAESGKLAGWARRSVTGTARPVGRRSAVRRTRRPQRAGEASNLDNQDAGRQHHEHRRDDTMEPPRLGVRPGIERTNQLGAAARIGAALLDRTGVAHVGAGPVAHEPALDLVRPEILVLRTGPGVVIGVVGPSPAKSVSRECAASGRALVSDGRDAALRRRAGKPTRERGGRRDRSASPS